MQLVNTTTRRLITAFALFFAFQISVSAQDNSPFSRYGIGDLMNSTNMINRGMGGASVGFGSERFLNANNPASYSFIGSADYLKNQYGGKLITFEVGTEYNGSTYKQKSPSGNYKTGNLLFNYMQMGMQLSKKSNWGFNFGLLPVSKENYKIATLTRNAIDSIQTVYDGNGSTNKLFFGTGYRIKNFSVGFNSGYFFGKKNTSTNISLLNDTVQFFESSSNTKTSLGKFFLQGGVLYKIPISKTKTIGLGATYELQNKINANQDLERIVYESTSNSPIGNQDTVYIKKDISGDIIMPSTYAIGFNFEEKDKFVFGLDYTSTAWNNYRFYGAADQVQNSWKIKSGLQWTPDKYGQKKYWSRATYSTGFYYGKDYIKANGDLPVYALTLGIGLPIPGDRQRPEPVVNLMLESGKRGNNNNNLTENFVKVGLSVSLADIWFVRRKYD